MYIEKLMYKIRHKPTGLYFAGKYKFTKRGKAYSKKPSLNSYFSVSCKYFINKSWQYISYEDLEIVDYGRSYFFAQDDDCHWYCIPEKLRKLWNKFMSTPDAWEYDEFDCFEEYRVNGSIEDITFKSPNCYDEVYPTC